MTVLVIYGAIGAHVALMVQKTDKTTNGHDMGEKEEDDRANP